MSPHSKHQHQPTMMSDLFKRYQIDDYFDEMFEAPDHPRPHCRQLYEQLQSLSVEEVAQYQSQAARAFLDQGITFTVYGDEQRTERIFPFDLLPRIIPYSEWHHIEQGVGQRIRALNAILLDIYGDQCILREGITLREPVEGAAGFQRDFVGVTQPKNLFVHVAGIDLVWDTEGTHLVLEDNLRTPSGVSYVFESRVIMKLDKTKIAMA